LESSSQSESVAVVGGGVIGLAVAWRAAQRGLRVTVLDAGDPPGAWRFAAGMLAPVTEAEHGEDALFELGLRAASGYAAFCEELSEAAGLDPGYRRAGTLVVARDRDEAEELDRLAVLHRSLGLETERLLPSAARRVEPGLAPTVRLALHVPGDHAVDPRALVAALGEAARLAGADLRTASVAAVRTDGDRATGVVLADGTDVPADHVVLAAGAWTGRLEGIPESAQVPVRPVKGQIMRLRDPRGPGLVERTIRTREAYLVPRGEGTYILGATVEERGWDTAPTAGATMELIRDLAEILPGVLELEVEELGAGLRPGTPDNLPVIGASALDGLVWATGHFRNGILLAAVTADIVAELLTSGVAPAWASPADPARFSGAVV